MNIPRCVVVGVVVACIGVGGRVGGQSKRVSGPQAGPDLTVDVLADRHPISPAIYGIAAPDSKLAQEIDLPVLRRSSDTVIRFQLKEGLSFYARGSGPEGGANAQPRLPARLGYSALADKVQLHALVARSLDPRALILAPGFVPTDEQNEGVPGDGKAEHDSLELTDYFLQEMRARATPNSGACWTASTSTTIRSGRRDRPKRPFWKPRAPSGIRPTWRRTTMGRPTARSN